GGQFYDEFAALSFFTDDPDIPMMKFHERFHQVKADAAALFFGTRIKPGLLIKAEYPALPFGGDADACILYRDGYASFSRVYGNYDRTAGPCEPYGIRKQVQHHPFRFFDIDGGDYTVVGPAEPEIDLLYDRIRPDSTYDFFQEHAQVAVDGLQHQVSCLRLCKVEEVVRQPHHPVAVGLYCKDIFPDILTIRIPAARDAAICGDFIPAAVFRFHTVAAVFQFHLNKLGCPEDY